MTIRRLQHARGSHACAYLCDLQPGRRSRKGGTSARGAHDSLHADFALWPTDRAGHAVELATRAVEEGFAKIVAAGGDGTAHEVANGVLASGRRDVIFSVWPVGSANDYAYSTGMDVWWKKRHEALPTEIVEVDVGRVTTGRKEEFFVCNLGVGFNGMVNGEARQTRWLAGMPLYAWAFLKAMVKHFATPTMTIRFDDREVTTPTLALSILNGQREGNFPLRPNASLTDGLFDYMHATRLTARPPDPLPSRDGHRPIAGRAPAHSSGPRTDASRYDRKRRSAFTPMASLSASHMMG